MQSAPVPLLYDDGGSVGVPWRFRGDGSSLEAAVFCIARPKRPLSGGPSLVTTIAALQLPNPEATASLAKSLAAIARAGDIFALWGDLGTGKTAFARAFIRARGEAESEIPSPTFTLVQTYEPFGSSCPIQHFDLYRLTAVEDAYELAIDEAFATAICLLEWPDRLGPLLPADRLDVHLATGETADARRATLAGTAPWRARLQEIGLV